MAPQILAQIKTHIIETKTNQDLDQDDPFSTILKAAQEEQLSLGSQKFYTDA